MAREGPKWGREVLFPANPDLLDILGDTDLDFENFYFLDFLDTRFLDFQFPRFPEICPGPGLTEVVWPTGLRSHLEQKMLIGRRGAKVRVTELCRNQ